MIDALWRVAEWATDAPLMLLLVAIGYVLIALGFWKKADWYMLVVFICYAVANVAFALKAYAE